MFKSASHAASAAGLALTIAAVAMPAAARDLYSMWGAAGQARLVCDLLANGRLQECRVVSRLAAATPLDRAALEAAANARVAPLNDAAPGPIHFPVRFLLEADYERESAILQPPVAIPANDTTPATVPALPTGIEARAWGGLNCIVTPSGVLVRCLSDNRHGTRGLLKGDLVYFVSIRTLSGEIIELPEQLPALPSEAVANWTQVAGVSGDSEHVLDVSRSNGVRLFWRADVQKFLNGYGAQFFLEEYDCRGERARTLLRAHAQELDPSENTKPGLEAWWQTSPGPWRARSEIRGTALAHFNAMCAA